MMTTGWSRLRSAAAHASSSGPSMVCWAGSWPSLAVCRHACTWVSSRHVRAGGVLPTSRWPACAGARMPIAQLLAGFVQVLGAISRSRLGSACPTRGLSAPRSGCSASSSASLVGARLVARIPRSRSGLVVSLTGQDPTLPSGSPTRLVPCCACGHGWCWSRLVWSWLARTGPHALTRRTVSGTRRMVRCGGSSWSWLVLWAEAASLLLVEVTAQLVQRLVGSWPASCTSTGLRVWGGLG
jgi:hypothetical protein